MNKRAVGAPPAKKAAAAARKTTTKPRAGKAAGKSARTVKPEEGFAHGGSRLADRDLPDALTPDEEAFVTEYLRNGMNGTAAILRVHKNLSPEAAAVKASRLIKVGKIRDRIRSERLRIAAAHEATREELLGECMRIVRADPNELTSMRAVACKHCWGGTLVDLPGEEKGADGPKLRPLRSIDPDPECPACNGEGHVILHVADTRKLSPDGLALFQGIHETKDGIKVLMHSKLDALEKAAKMIGAYELDNRQKADPLVELLKGIGRSALPVVRDPAGG